MIVSPCHLAPKVYTIFWRGFCLGASSCWAEPFAAPGSRPGEAEHPNAPSNQIVLCPLGGGGSLIATPEACQVSLSHNKENTLSDRGSLHNPGNLTKEILTASLLFSAEGQRGEPVQGGSVDARRGAARLLFYHSQLCIEIL